MSDLRIQLNTIPPSTALLNNSGDWCIESGGRARGLVVTGPEEEPFRACLYGSTIGIFPTLEAAAQALFPTSSLGVSHD